MKILFALVVGFLLAFALFLLSPLIREQVARGRRRLMFWRLAMLANRLEATMFAGAATPVRTTMLTGSDVAQLSTTVNRLIDDLETLRAAYVLHQHAALNAAPSTNAIAAAALVAGKLTYQGANL